MKQLIEIIKELDLFKKANHIHTLDLAIVDNKYYVSGYSNGGKVLELKGDLDK